MNNEILWFVIGWIIGDALLSGKPQAPKVVKPLSPKEKIARAKNIQTAQLMAITAVGSFLIFNMLH